MSSAEPRPRTVIVSWLAVYPTITPVGASTLLLTATLPWTAKTLVLTALMVPLVVYLTGPLARGVHGDRPSERTTSMPNDFQPQSEST
jgi:antibiotic biosynthesis monooxygenase (ABM) superfamily enzyme